jgi:NADH-quinone oxidoreductase subunit H
VNAFCTLIAQPWFRPVITTIAVLAITPLFIGYMSLVERKVLADFQARYGPMRVGPHGLLQPIADALKFLLKEDTVPAAAERSVFLLAPIFSVLAAMVGLAVLPFASHIFIADINVALLLIVSVSALSVLGIILGGWASGSHYPLLGALRSAAQLVSYEVALTLGLLATVTVSGTLSLRGTVEAQLTQRIWFLFSNFGAMLLPFLVFVLASIVETNRSPFDLPEAESELVGGYHTEFSGFRFALYMLAEWANILVLSAVAVTLFFGGWLRPFPNTARLSFPLDVIFPLLTCWFIAAYCVRVVKRSFFAGEKMLMFAIAAVFLVAGGIFLIPALRAELSALFWFFFKLSLFIYVMIWLRATLPRVRYDHLMKLGWKWLIPIGIVGVAANAVLGML